MTAVDDILAAWGRGKSALLYGPPGTGKTRILSELLAELERSDPPVSAVALDPSDSRSPFKIETARSSSSSAGLPKPIKTVWLTFHQSLGYEDFVIGLRPESESGQITLVPHVGALLDAVLELQADDGAQAVVLLIDEINRGNAARIFGEFLTFLDFEYRETLPDGAPNPLRLPLPIRHLSYVEDAYAPVQRPNGMKGMLKHPSYFPRHIYVVATMNSVDRTAIPIDSALARRFERIDIRPDVEVLAERWSVETATLGTKAGTPVDLKAAETAILLLDRFNLTLAENFGSDFELGHGLLLDLDPEAQDAWVQLARIWDRLLFPQLEDRFSGRTEELATALRVEEFAAQPYAWRFRSSLAGDSSNSVIAPVTLSALAPDIATASLQLLASRPHGL